MWSVYNDREILFTGTLAECKAWSAAHCGPYNYGQFQNAQASK